MKSTEVKYEIGEAENKKRDSETTRQRILDTALKLFADNGYECTTTREICKQADVNINLIYYYFGGKKELYDELLKTVLDKQIEYLEQYIDLEANLEKMNYREKVDLLYSFVDKMIDFAYKVISKDQIRLFLRVQQDSKESIMSPAYEFLMGVMRSILGKDADVKKIVYRTLFLMSQVVFPRLVPIFSLGALKQDDFNETDIQIIKENVENYIVSIYLKDCPQ